MEGECGGGRRLRREGERRKGEEKSWKEGKEEGRRGGDGREQG